MILLSMCINSFLGGRPFIVKSPRCSWKLTHLLPPPFHVRVPFPHFTHSNYNQHMKTLFKVKTQT